MPKTNGLSRKQSRFVEEYLVDFNATQAAIRAGYREKTAYSIGWENLRKDYIRQAIEDRIRQLSDTADEGTREFLRQFKESAGMGRILADRRKGVVYFLRADNGLVKVGITVNLARRMATLNTMLPYELKPLLVVNCDNCPEVERSLHDRFADRRIKGEWFRLTDDDIDWARLTYGSIQKTQGIR